MAVTATVPESQRRAAEAALSAVADEPPVSVERLGRGNRKQTRLVEFADRAPVVVQLCDDASRLRTEAALLGRIRARTFVPVPRVLAAGARGRAGFLVTPYVEGVDLHEQFTGLSPNRRRSVAAAFGEYLASLHEQLRFDGYGPVTADGGRLTAQCQSWAEWFVEYGRGAVDRLPPAFDPLRESLLAAVADHRTGAPPTASLFPWDFRPGNALAADGRVTAVLDWETPLAAAPALSVAKAEYLVADWYVEESRPLRRGFVRGYTAVRPYPDVRPAHRVAAVADSAVDSNGVVTNPRYPEVDRDAAVDVHRSALARIVDDG
jgi:aminoglycoside phosphotransferase (APT) family kinase protein